MSKTKEQIIEEYIPCTCGEIYTSRKMVAPDCPKHAFAVEEAMDEYAKNKAIDFAEWGNEQDLQGHPEGWVFKGDQFKKVHSMEDLYNLFLQSQSQ